MARATTRRTTKLLNATLRVGGAAAAGATGTLWIAKFATSPEADTRSWWRGRTVAASIGGFEGKSCAEAELSLAQSLKLAGVALDELLSAARLAWSGVEFAAESAAAAGRLGPETVRHWREVGALPDGSAQQQRPVPETQQTYAADVGGAAPVYLGRDTEAPRLSMEAILRTVASLRDEGAALVSGAVPEADVVKLRRRFRIASADGPLACPREVSGADVLAAARGARSPLEPSSGRRHFLIRGTELAEEEIVPLLAPLMPCVHRYFAEHRPDAFPGALLDIAVGGQHAHETLPRARQFLSECQVLISDPGAVNQIWHRDNRRSGLTFVIPLTDVDMEVGPTHLIPGSHRLDTGGEVGSFLHTLCGPFLRSGGAIAAAPLRAGDALVYDARILHRGLGNDAWSRCRAVIVLRLDCTDTPPPGATILQTSASRLTGTLLQSLGFLYRALPAPAGR
eukprot:TRINITY_DN30233_c0_g1_i1.p1 TRINITY_DN30233_c0_g1~~TRINITY_DN30233_c0_g1_i1.p1  ORF type:complete len:454 (-),score=66.07 TRINITY_DN30233_c0_g1_i1:198-1559(-)